MSGRTRNNTGGQRRYTPLQEKLYYRLKGNNPGVGKLAIMAVVKFITSDELVNALSESCDAEYTEEKSAEYSEEVLLEMFTIAAQEEYLNKPEMMLKIRRDIEQIKKDLASRHAEQSHSSQGAQAATLGN